MFLGSLQVQEHFHVMLFSVRGPRRFTAGVFSVEKSNILAGCVLGKTGVKISGSGKIFA